jgi:hypothetical protein
MYSGSEYIFLLSTYLIVISQVYQVCSCKSIPCFVDEKCSLIFTQGKFLVIAFSPSSWSNMCIRICFIKTAKKCFTSRLIDKRNYLSYRAQIFLPQMQSMLNVLINWTNNGEPGG